MGDSSRTVSISIKIFYQQNFNFSSICDVWVTRMAMHHRFTDKNLSVHNGYWGAFYVRYRNRTWRIPESSRTLIKYFQKFPTGAKISREILGDKLFPLDYHLLRSPNWIIPIRFWSILVHLLNKIITPFVHIDWCNVYAW